MLIHSRLAETPGESIYKANPPTYMLNDSCGDQQTLRVVYIGACGYTSDGDLLAKRN